LKACVGSSARLALVTTLAAAALTAVLLGGSGAASAGETLDSPGGGLSATIRTTSHGVPHILASNFAGLGYGYGYVAARENICVLADTYVTANAERSRWFGPDGTYTQGGNGATQTNLNSDFFFQRVKDTGVIQRLTPSCDALYVPDIDRSLDEEVAKREFWAAFRALGEWYADFPPY